jgi:AhpD family alkylhydroperoxidase
MDFDATARGFAKAMAALDRAAVAQADEAGLDPLLRELVRLRASQLNGCAYCVDMHAKDARAAGEEDRRLDALAVWREAPFYSDADAVALELTEAVTLCADGHVPEPLWQAAAERFSPPELAALVALVVAVNAWNRIGVTTRTWLPGSYAP